MTTEDLKILGHIALSIDSEKLYDKIRDLLPKGYYFGYSKNKTRTWMDVKSLKYQYDIKSNFNLYQRWAKPRDVEIAIYKYYYTQWEKDYKPNLKNPEFYDLKIQYKTGSNTFTAQIGYNEFTEYNIFITRSSNHGWDYTTIIETKIDANTVLTNRKKLQDRKQAMSVESVESLTLTDFFPNIDSYTLDIESDTFIDQLIKLEAEVNSAPNPKV